MNIVLLALSIAPVFVHAEASIALHPDIDEAVVRHVRAATFSVEAVACGRTIGTGTAYAVGDSNTLVTALHVIRCADTLKVANLSTGHTYSVDAVDMVDVRLDQVRLHLEVPAPEFLTVRDAPLRQGLGILVYGNPAGMTATLATGSVGSIDPDRRGLIQLDVNVSPGSSGGPVCDTTGQVLGTVVSKLVGSSVAGIAFAGPIRPLLDHTRLVRPLEFGTWYVQPSYLSETKPDHIPRIICENTFINGKPLLVSEQCYDQWGCMTTYASVGLEQEKEYDKHGVLIRYRSNDHGVAKPYCSYPLALDAKPDARFMRRLFVDYSWDRESKQAVCVSDNSFACALSVSTGPVSSVWGVVDDSGYCLYYGGLQELSCSVMRLPGEGFPSSSCERFSYRLDRYGNWIERYSSTADSASMSSLIVESAPEGSALDATRKIEYWE